MTRTSGTPCLLLDAEPPPTAEPYGDCLTHPRGHHEVWSVWRRRGSAWRKARGWPLAVLTHEYEDFPRGRVVFHVPSGAWWIYADRQLQLREAIATIESALGLTGATCLVKSDSHYR